MWKHPLLLLVVFFAALLAGREPGSKYWWRIGMVISVAGEYEYKDNQNNFDGYYSFQIKLSAAMERDNGDYLLYKGEQSLEALTWKETLHHKAGTSQEHELSGKINPLLELNYVLRLRKPGKIRFDFGIPSIPLPFNSPKPLKQITLPRSAENESLDPGTGYNKGIVTGSNQVELIDGRIYSEEEVENLYNWTWQTKDRTWSNSHRVELKLRIIRQKK